MCLLARTWGGIGAARNDGLAHLTYHRRLYQPRDRYRATARNLHNPCSDRSDRHDRRETLSRHLRAYRRARRNAADTVWVDFTRQNNAAFSIGEGIVDMPFTADSTGV